MKVCEAGRENESSYISTETTIIRKSNRVYYLIWVYFCPSLNNTNIRSVKYQHLISCSTLNPAAHMYYVARPDSKLELATFMCLNIDPNIMKQVLAPIYSSAE